MGNRTEHELEQLRGAVDDAVAMFRRIADHLAQAVELLPTNVSDAEFMLFHQNIALLRVVATGLGVEAGLPDKQVIGSVSRLGRVVLAGVLSLGGVVGVGVGEEAGSDLWHDVPVLVEKAHSTIDRVEHQVERMLSEGRPDFRSIDWVRSGATSSPKESDGRFPLGGEDQP